MRGCTSDLDGMLAQPSAGVIAAMGQQINGESKGSSGIIKAHDPD